MTVINTQDFADITVAADTQPVAAKVFNPASVKTKKHATHLLTLAEARLEKQRADVRSTKEHIEVLQGLADTLPESATPSVTHKVVCQEGDEVTFNFGREERRTQKTGIVRGVKVGDNGLPAQYRVVVGAGFDEQSFRIFPGQIVGNEPAEESEDLFDNPAEGADTAV